MSKKHMSYLDVKPKSCLCGGELEPTAKVECYTDHRLQCKNKKCNFSVSSAAYTKRDRTVVLNEIKIMKNALDNLRQELVLAVD